MFHTPLNQITYEQVEAFCREFPEGVRAEYKQEPGSNIPKVISSFANTAGGIWVIGVETDKATNLPKFPLAGMKRRAGVEEQLVQSAHTGIYPSITPGVRVLDMPGKPDRMLTVVKVSESIEAPHAIENTTKIYIRNASTTEPYELADMDRIEYFLKRRQQPEQRREALIDQMAQRSWCRAYQNPRRRVIVGPLYPRGIVLPYDRLLERAQRLQDSNTTEYMREFRLIHEGISSVGSAGLKEFYFEANTSGMTFFEDQAKTRGEATDEFDDTKTKFVYLPQLLAPLALALNTALVFLKGEVTNIFIRYELIGWQGIGHLPVEYSKLAHPGRTARQCQATDPVISVSATAVLETFRQRRVEVVTDMMSQVLWAFNTRIPNLSERVSSLLHEDNSL